MNKDNREIEIKIKIEDPEVLLKKILELGGIELEDKEGLEHDVMYDDGKGFYDAHKVLRLRTTPFGNLLTYKEKTSESDHKSLLIRTEIETFIKNAETMDQIIRKLGFFPYRVKDKYVRKINLDNLILEFHKLPFIGDFLEIEAEETELTKVLEKINFSMESGINQDYGTLFYNYCKQKNLPSDTPMTFEEEKKHGLQK